MKCLLFVSFNNGLLHNSIYNSLSGLCASIKQLIEDEELDMEQEKVPTHCHLEKYLNEHDDYVGKFTNGTWYHIQLHPVFGVYP